VQETPVNVSEVMVQYPKGAGVGHVFGYPGDPSLGLDPIAGFQTVLGNSRWLHERR